MVNSGEQISVPLIRREENWLWKKIWMGLLLIATFQSLGRSIFLITLDFYEPLVYLSLVVFMFFYLMDKAVKKIPINGLEFMIIFFLIFIPLQSVLAAKYYWGEPFIYAFLATKAWTFSIVAIVFFYQLKKRNITLYQINDILITIAWTQFICYTLIGIFFTPHNPDVSYQECNDVKGGCFYAFDMLFICYALLFYFFKFFKTNSYKYLVYAILFFAYIFFFYQKRSLNITLIGTIGIYFLFNVSLKKKIVYSFTLISFLVISFGLIYFLEPAVIHHLLKAYGNIVDFVEGQKVQEASAGSRVKQVIISGLFLARNPSSFFFGNGQWSNHWGGNPQMMFGRYYPNEVGILGMWVTYGLIGILVVQLEFLLPYLWIRKVKINKNDLLFQTCKYYMVFYWIKSLPTGGSYSEPGLGAPFIFITMLFFFYYIEKNPHLGYTKGDDKISL